MSTINISGLDKADVLYTLYCAAQGDDMGVSKELIQSRLDKGQTFFSALGKKVMRISVAEDEMDVTDYNRQNGVAYGQPMRDGFHVGKAQKALEDAGLVDPQSGTEVGFRSALKQPPPRAEKSVAQEESGDSSSNSGLTEEAGEPELSNPEEGSGEPEPHQTGSDDSSTEPEETIPKES